MILRHMGTIFRFFQNNPIISIEHEYGLVSICPSCFIKSKNPSLPITYVVMWVRWYERLSCPCHETIELSSIDSTAHWCTLSLEVTMKTLVMLLIGATILRSWYYKYCYTFSPFDRPWLFSYPHHSPVWQCVVIWKWNCTYNALTPVTGSPKITLGLASSNRLNHPPSTTAYISCDNSHII